MVEPLPPRDTPAIEPPSAATGDATGGVPPVPGGRPRVPGGRHRRGDVPAGHALHGGLVAAAVGRGPGHAVHDPGPRGAPVRHLRGRPGAPLRPVLHRQPGPQHRDPAPVQPGRRRAQEPQPPGRVPGAGHAGHRTRLRHRATVEPRPRVRGLPAVDPTDGGLVGTVRDDVDLPGHPAVPRTTARVHRRVPAAGDRRHRHRHGGGLLPPAPGDRRPVVRPRHPGGGRPAVPVDRHPPRAWPVGRGGPSARPCGSPCRSSRCSSRPSCCRRRTGSSSCATSGRPPPAATRSPTRSVPSGSASSPSSTSPGSPGSSPSPTAGRGPRCWPPAATASTGSSSPSPSASPWPARSCCGSGRHGPSGPSSCSP